MNPEQPNTPSEPSDPSVEIGEDMIKEWLAKLAPFRYQGDNPIILEENQRIEKTIINREIIFYRQVCQAIEQALEERPASKEEPLIILFDIDETLGKANYPKGVDGQTDWSKQCFIFRPALDSIWGYLKAKLDQQIVRIGTLSGRGKDNQLDQLKDPDVLEPIANIIDENLVNSASDFEYKKLSEADIQELISPNMLTKDQYGSPQWLSYADQGKMFALLQIARTNSHSSLVVVDDHAYPDLLNPINGYYGVSLGNGASFYMPDDWVTPNIAQSVDILKP